MGWVGDPWGRPRLSSRANRSLPPLQQPVFVSVSIRQSPRSPCQYRRPRSKRRLCGSNDLTGLDLPAVFCLKPILAFLVVLVRSPVRASAVGELEGLELVGCIWGVGVGAGLGEEPGIPGCLGRSREWSSWLLEWFPRSSCRS